MTVKILGEAVDYKVYAVLQRTDYVGCCKGAVHAIERAAQVGNFADSPNIHHIGEGIGNHFGVQNPGVGTHGTPDGIKV